MQEAEDMWGPQSANLMAYFLFFLKCVCVSHLVMSDSL